MLNFALPLALWLSLSIFPAALFYFLRLRFRRQPVGSSFLWLALRKESKDTGNKLRWKSVLLFLLQLLALLAITFAAALPRLLHRNLEKPGVVYLLDASASMATRDGTLSGNSGAVERFVQGKEALLADMKGRDEDTPVAVFLCDSGLREIGGGNILKNGAKAGDSGRFAAALSAAAPSLSGFSEKAAAEGLEAWLTVSGGSWSAVLVTDGGLDLGGGSLASVFGDTLRTIDVGTAAPNLALGSFRRENSGNGSLSFTVVNQGSLTASVPVALSRDGTELQRTVVQAPSGYSRHAVTLEAASAGENFSVDFSLPAADDLPGDGAVPSGVYSLTILGNEDAQAIDDTAYLAVNPARRVRILHIGNENRFIRSALSWPTVDYTELPSFPSPLSADDWDLVIADGTEVPPGLDVNLLCLGVLPPGSGIRWTGETSGKLEAVSSSHPLARYIDWLDTEVTEGWGMDVPSGVRPLALVGKQVLAAAWEQDGRRIAVFGTDLSHSTLGLSGGFPVFLRNMFQWCVPQSENPLSDTFVVGEPRARAEPSSWGLVNGSPAEAKRDGNDVVITALAPGPFAWKQGTGGGFLAANIPFAELDTAPRRLAGIRSALDERSAIEDSPQALKYSTRVTSVSFLPLLAAIAFLALEWLFWFGTPRFLKGGQKQTDDKKKDALRPSSPIRPLLALRIASLLCLLLALFGASVPLPGGRQNRVILLDVSASLGAKFIERERSLALEYIKKMEGKDRVAIIAFAGKSILVADLQKPAQAAEILKSANLGGRGDEDQTDVSSALSLASRIVRGVPGSASALLLSDGRPTKGGTLADIASSIMPFPVHCVALTGQGGGIFSRNLSAPPSLREGDTASVKWTVETDRPRRIEVRLRLDGKIAYRRTEIFLPGTSVLDLPVGTLSRGLHRVDLESFSEDGTQVRQLESAALLDVGSEASVFLVKGNSGPSPLGAALRTQGVKNREGPVSSLPETEEGYADCSAVILDNVAALELSEAQQAELQNYVAAGGGLLVVGGDRSLGRGDYYSTKLEDMLPVITDTRQRIFFTRSRILFVVDHSGSMSDIVGGDTKLQAAMQGVAGSLEQLSPLDEVGILGFGSQPTWLLPFTPVREKKAILESLSSFPDGGGTDLFSALDEMAEAFRNAGPVRRHVILLTDGQDSIPEENFRELAERLKYLGVSMTAIGIGDEINETLLKDLASMSGGAFYRAEADRIPKLIDEETVRVTRDLVQEGIFLPRAVRSGGPIGGIEESIPPITGYLVTKAKDQAELWLDVQGNAPAALPGREPVKAAFDPLLASWHYGNGKVTVFTADSGLFWLGPWSGKTVYNRFWAQTVRGVERAGKSAGLQVEAQIEASRARLSVEAIGENRTLQTGLRLVADSGKRRYVLRETVGGHYEADIPLEGSGLQQFTVRDLSGRAQASAWAWNPPGMELAWSRADFPGLGNLSSLSGGVLLPDSGAVPLPRGFSWEWVSLAWTLLVLAMGLFLLELGLRSTMLGQMKMAAALVHDWWDIQIHRLDRKVESDVPHSRSTDEDQERTMNAYRTLARRIAEREAAEKDT